MTRSTRRSVVVSVFLVAFISPLLPLSDRITSPAVAQAAPAGGLLTTIPPLRIYDSRASSPIGPGQTRRLVVGGTGGVPVGASAVSLNVTAVSPTSSTFLTVWPAGAPFPTTSNLNVVADAVRPNSVIVGLGVNSAIDIYNASGSTNVLVDVNGFFSAGTIAPGGLTPVTPSRLLDTRSAIGISTTSPLGTAQALNVQIAGRGGVPTTGVAAVVLNVTGTAPSASTFVTVWPTNLARPEASSLNLAAGETSPNLVIVPLGAAGQISMFNAFGTTHLLADVLGWIADGTPGVGGFVPVSPVRVFDSRGSAPLRPGGWMPVTVAGSGLPTNGVAAVASNITAVNASSSSYLSAFPTSPGFSGAGFVPGAVLPEVSNLNVAANQTVPNAAIVAVGPQLSFWLFNFAGTFDALVDISGYWVGTTPNGSAPPKPAAGPGPGGFLRSVNSGGIPLFWDTCSPIVWRVDPTNGTQKGLEEVVAAVDRVQKVTGLPLQYGGTTDSYAPYSSGNREIRIFWRSSSEDPNLVGSTIGYARYFFRNSGEIVQSDISLRTDGSALLSGFGPGPSYGALLIHELGHAMGLSHTSDSSQIMYPIINSALDEYGAGDLTGLAGTKREGCYFTTQSGPVEERIVIG